MRSKHRPRPPRARKEILTPEEILQVQIDQSKIGHLVGRPCREYQFNLLREWRFDFAWPHLKVAVEIHGGIWRRGGGAHTGVGHLRDLEKANDAQLDHWRIFAFTSDQAKNGEAITFLERRLFKLVIRGEA